MNSALQLSSNDVGCAIINLTTTNVHKCQRFTIHTPYSKYTKIKLRHTNPQTRSVVTHAGFFDNIIKNFRSDDDDEADNKMVELDPDNQRSLDGQGEDTFGPLAVLAVGYLQHEFQQIASFLTDIGGDEIALLPCTREMLSGSLGQALLSNFEDPPDHEEPPLGSQRIIFLSGMYSSEVMEVVGGYKEDGLPEAVFAAAVPKSWNRNLQELIDDVAADHAEMRKKKAQAELEAAQAAAAGVNGSDGAPP